MVLLIGGLVVCAIWAFGIAWISQIAASRGRSVLGWALAGGAAGLAGLLAGLELLGGIVGSDSDWALLGGLAPLLMLVAPMAGMAFGLQRMTVRTARRASWKVHSPSLGAGKLSVSGGRLVLAWPGNEQEVALDQLRVRIDGECLRIGWGDVEHVLMPMEKPQNRAGRQAQCRALALQLTHK